MHPRSVLLCFCICLLALLRALPPAAAQPASFDPALAQRLQAQLDQLRSTYRLKGISAAVTVPRQGTWNGVTGISHGAVPIDSNMVFNIGSASKNLVAATILLLQEDSLLRLDDPLRLYLPTYPYVDSSITIRQLLQHRSGLYNITDNPAWQNMINSSAQVWTSDSVLKTFMRPAVGAPGAGFRYCNTNFVLLGRIIEEVTDSSVAEVLRHRLLNRHGLSSFYMQPYETATGTRPHNWSDPSMTGQNPADIAGFNLTALLSSTAAAGALVANARDLARWTELLFTGQVLQPASLQEMVSFMPATGGMTGYGLGLMRYSNQGKTVWGHGGNVAGFASCFAFSPSDSVVVSILVNQDVIGRNLALSLLTAAQQYLTLALPEELAASQPQLQCLPNPSSGSGTIRFVLKQSQPVEVQLRNVLGQTVAVVAEGIYSQGEHQVQVKTELLPSGMYFCCLRTTTGTRVQRWLVEH